MFLSLVFYRESATRDSQEFLRIPKKFSNFQGRYFDHILRLVGSYVDSSLAPQANKPMSQPMRQKKPNKANYAKPIKPTKLINRNSQEIIVEQARPSQLNVRYELFSRRLSFMPERNEDALWFRSAMPPMTSSENYHESLGITSNY